MNPSTSVVKGMSTTNTSIKKRRAPSDLHSNPSTLQPASKKPRTTTSKATKGTKPKKGPACATCRKKKIRCAHRLELGSVTKHPSALPLPSLANERTEPSSSVNNPSSHPVKDSSHSTPSEAPEPTKTASPTTPKKFPKLDKDRNATPEYRERIERDRQKYTIQFTEEDWYREPRWASRVFGGYDTVEEHLFHATAPRHGSSAGKTPTPSLSMCETNSSKSCDVDILQSFAKENPQAYLSSPLNGPLASVLDGCLKVRNQSKDRPLTSPLVSVPESQDSTKIPQLISSTGYRTASISESEKDWLKKTDAWKAEAHALVYDQKASYDDWSR